MRAVRQAAGGLIYGIISLLLVLGSLALAQAQGGAPAQLAPTFTPLPSSTATAGRALGAPTATMTEVAATATPFPATKAPTLSPPTITRTTAAPRATATSASRCAAPYGWMRAYVVQPGDTLYRIARLYGVSVDALRAANCRSSTLIYVGEHLWVPYAWPAATELTIIPTFPTPTDAGATGVTPETPDP